jgi:cytochrome c556
MTKAMQLLALVTIVPLASFGVSALTTQADESADEHKVTAHLPYRTMRREEVEELGGAEKDKKRPYDAKAVEAGLNRLHADGWELVAVEGGRTFTTLGQGQAVIEQPSIYIFRRTRN